MDEIDRYVQILGERIAAESFASPSWRLGHRIRRGHGFDGASFVVDIAGERVRRVDASPDSVDTTIETDVRWLRATFEGQSLDTRTDNIPVRVRSSTARGQALAPALIHLVSTPNPVSVETLRRIDAREQPFADRVARVPTTDAHIGHALEHAEPAIVEGVASSWGCAEWTPDIVRSGPVGELPLAPFGRMAKARRGRLKHAFTSEDAYSAGHLVQPEMAAFVGAPPVFDTEQWNPGCVFCGLPPVGRANTMLHRDPMHSLMTNVFGRKRVRLYPPSATATVRPVRHFGRYQPSWFAFETDTELPGNSIDVVVEGGESLIIPAGWWHEVVADTPTFTVSHFLKRASAAGPHAHRPSWP